MSSIGKSKKSNKSNKSKKPVLPFQIGDKVISDFYKGEEKVIRIVTRCTSAISCGSGFRISTDGGKLCPCCGLIGRPLVALDSTWCKLVEAVK